jgi:methionyl-tRNA formyltransferase
VLRVIFFGMTGHFSRPPLQALLAAGLEVSAVLVPATPPGRGPLPRRLDPPQATLSDLPILNPRVETNILHLAWDNHCPVWEVGPLSDRRTLEVLTALRPDLIVVACFPRLFPAPLLHLPRYGCLNLHPSLLPAFRGPVPLFWMARNGEAQAGVTLHFLDEGLDTGDIVAQTALPWPDGLTESELTARCAEAGAALLLAAVNQLAQDQALPRRPQPEVGSSYFPYPSPQDFVIPTHWAVRRAFNFLRAAASWPLLIEVGEERTPIRVAINYESGRTLDQPYQRDGKELRLQFRGGVLTAGI